MTPPSSKFPILATTKPDGFWNFLELFRELRQLVTTVQRHQVSTAVGGKLDYQVGMFIGDDNGANDRSGATAAGRFEWELSNDLVLAFFASEGTITAIDTEPENGLDGRMPSGYRFFDDVYVDGTRRRLGGDVEWGFGERQFTVEGLRVRDERHGQGVDFDDFRSVIGKGANLTARWRFAPRREVAARYEHLGFDDVGPDTDADSVRSRAANIRPRGCMR